jgi:hypothetical protein
LVLPAYVAGAFGTTTPFVLPFVELGVVLPVVGGVPPPAALPALPPPSALPPGLLSTTVAGVWPAPLPVVLGPAFALDADPVVDPDIVV